MRFRLPCLGLALIGLWGCSSPQPELIVKPFESQYVERGMELAEGLAACGFCHGSKPSPGSPLSGGRAQYDSYGEVLAANITPARSGIGGWNTIQVMQALRLSKNPEGDDLSPDIHRGYEWLSDEDLISVVAYLKAIPPQENEVDRRSISFIDRNTTGILKRAPEVGGYVPSLNPKFTIEYGRYLTEHVARCQYCHNSPGGFVTGEYYLGGGRPVRVGDEQIAAPDITGSVVAGIGSWSAEDIVQYLLQGRTPQGRFINRKFCPIDYYSRAPMADLVAIAKYLKTVPASD